MPTEDVLNTNDRVLKAMIDPIFLGALGGKGSRIQLAAGIVEIDDEGDENWVYMRSFRPNLPLNLASLGKQFTGAAIASLVETNPSFSIDDRVNSILTDWPSYASSVRVRHLLNHTCGLRNYSGRPTRWLSRDPQSVVDWVAARNRRVRSPGQFYEYCNTGYVVLARIVETLSGTDFATFLTTRFLTPLGMNNTYVRPRGRGVVPRTMSRWFGRYAPAPGLLNDWMPGDGGVHSTVRDLGKWGRFLSGRSELGSSIPDVMMQDIPLDDSNSTPSGYGHGLWVGRRENRRARAWHNGSWNGARTDARFFSARGDDPDVFVVVLANAHTLDPGNINDRINNAYFARRSMMR